MDSAEGALEYARELEQDADRFPEERGELLLEAAEQWQGAGEHSRAVQVLTRVLALGGQDGELARVSLAGSYYELGRDQDAQAQLVLLRSSPPSSPLACELAGELLEARGDHRAALAWLDLGVGLLDAADLEGMRGPAGWLSQAAMLAGGRRRIREALGLEPDELDRAVPVPGVLPLPGVFPTMDEMLEETPDHLALAGEIHTLFWQVDQYYEVTRRWPEVFGEDEGGPAAYHANLEANWREASRRGAGRIVLVPATADGLAEFAEATGGDPGDSATRHAYTEMLRAAGVGISWPPGRNASCWCGSGRKYKKCCGGPAAR